MTWAPALAAAIPALLSYLENKGGKNDAKTSSTYGKGALSLLDQVQQSVSGMRGAQDITQNPQYQSGQEYLNSLFNDPEFFNKFEAPLQRQFNEETVPNLANRFAAMGSGGALGSTAFRNQLAREGSNLHTNIAALRGQMQQQGANQALQYAQQPFQNLQQLMQQALTPTNNQYQPANAGFWGPIAGAGASGAIQYYTGQNQPNAAQPQTYQPQYAATSGYDQEFRQRGVPFPGQSPTTY
jgi:hypothetical protein